MKWEKIKRLFLMEGSHFYSNMLAFISIIVSLFMAVFCLYDKFQIL